MVMVMVKMATAGHEVTRWDVRNGPDTSSIGIRVRIELARVIQTGPGVHAIEVNHVIMKARINLCSECAWKT